MDQQMVGAGTGALSGAAAGAEIGGPWGAAAGGIAGGILGYMGGSSKGYSLPWDQYNQRLSQIADYQNQLQGATSQYATAVGNMYTTAFNQYMPNAAAAFAGRGLGVDSGAFGAELGRTAATLTSQDLTDVAHMNINNIDKVNTQYGDAWAGMFGAANQSNKAGFDQGNANTAGLLGLATNIGGNAMRYKMNQNPWGGMDGDMGNPSEASMMTISNASRNPFSDYAPLPGAY